MINRQKTKTYFSPEEVDYADARVKEINQKISDKIGEQKYPCVGAKAAFNSNQYRLGIYGKMGSDDSTGNLGDDLKEYIAEANKSDSDYLTLIAVFDDEVVSELDFEQKLWMQLQKLYDSGQHNTNWDPRVSSNPEDDDFSFSFDGTAFFIVGLHPKASRTARRIPYVAMAFNLHRQFDKLRENGQFENMKKVIRNREMDYDGSINPMLKDFGVGKEAPQYSGRQVDKTWKCPFHAAQVHPEKEAYGQDD